MSSIIARLAPRDHRECRATEDGFIDESSCYVPFWYTKTGVIIKWSLFLGLILFISLYVLLGYLHAKKRIQKGLMPMAYHRFLVPRSQLARVDPSYQYPPATATLYYPNQYYGMHSMPPPVYDPNAARPPMYPGPPEGASKADPSQQGAPQAAQPSQAANYSAPPGPPPQTAGVTDNSNNNNPYRL